MNNRLRELRQEAKLSSQELAEALGTTKQNISMYENGKRQFLVPVLKKFCDFFAVTRGYLLGESEEGILLTMTNGFSTITRNEWNEYLSSGHATIINTGTQIIRQASAELSHSLFIEITKNRRVEIEHLTPLNGNFEQSEENLLVGALCTDLLKLNKEQLKTVKTIVASFIESNSTKKE